MLQVKQTTLDFICWLWGHKLFTWHKHVTCARCHYPDLDLHPTPSLMIKARLAYLFYCIAEAILDS